MTLKTKWQSRAKILRAAFLFLVLFGGILGSALILHPDTPLPDAWNPLKPLAVSDELTPLTGWKLSRTVRDPAACLVALNDAGRISANPAFFDSNDQCYISAPVEVQQIGSARMSGIETDCATALRLAMWEQHDLQALARTHLQTDVSAIRDIGSYNCRAMRTSRGATGRMSSHATASAIDIVGFRFGNGDSVSLLRDWDGAGQKSAFLKAARDSACKWFPVTLSPDYNTLHADHFHLQATGWGLCR
ncbi:Uncharacterized conserved protein [Cognatiyoonia koreensis]|uniref:Uncharacterized conserved protein n=1 Tax=Cognatiyoonia koreensis TaxID=364200 RepID=A0A1I0RQ04_9RHOB|nr:extensin family protein [Cognatiyoonia koreensis]SEW43372.1 Uncharacterized conserved protein [Cognatiyoonia koreensis]